MYFKFYLTFYSDILNFEIIKNVFYNGIWKNINEFNNKVTEIYITLFIPFINFISFFPSRLYKYHWNNIFLYIFTDEIRRKDSKKKNTIQRKLY